MRGSNSYQTEFAPMHGAIEGVQELHSIIPVIAYVTIRPETVQDGTIVWLKKHGFPTAEIIARPVDIPHADGNIWKAEKFLELYPRVQGIVDDNAGLLQFLPTDYKGHVFLYTHTTIQILH